MRFKIDYTFWRNVVFVLIGGALLWLGGQGEQGEHKKLHEPHGKAAVEAH